jgi:hypothetical protein
MDTTDSCHPTPSFRGPLFTPSPITQRAWTPSPHFIWF